MRFYKTAQEQTKEVVREREAKKCPSQGISTAPDTHTFEAALKALSCRWLARLPPTCTSDCLQNAALCLAEPCHEVLGMDLAATTAGTLPYLPTSTQMQCSVHASWQDIA